MLSASDGLGSGWFGAERIIVLSRHRARQQLVGEFGATDMVTERGDEGVAKIREMTDGLGALPVRARRYARVDDAGHPLHPL